MLIGLGEVHSKIAHNTNRHRWFGIDVEQPKGIAKGNGPFANDNVVAIGKAQGGKVRCLDLQEGHICRPIRTNDLCGILFPVRHRNHDLRGIARHMVVGDDVAIAGDQKARPKSLDRVFLTIGLVIPEELTEKRIGKERVLVFNLSRFRNIDAHNGRRTCFHGTRDGVLPRCCDLVVLWFHRRQWMGGKGHRHGREQLLEVLLHRGSIKDSGLTNDQANYSTNEERSVFVAVAIPVPLRRVFTYVIPADTEHACIGARVLVPFGNRVVTGVIVEMDVDAVDAARPIIELLDEEAALPPSVLDLTRFMAEYYMCSWGEAIQAALPSGLTPQSVVRVELVRDISESELDAMERRAPKRAMLLRAIMRHAGDVSVAYLQQQLRSTTIVDQLSALQHAGYVRVTNNVDEQSAPKTQSAVRIAEDLALSEQALRDALDMLDAKAPKQSLLLSQLYLARHAGTAPVLRSALLNEASASASALDGLVKRGFAEVVDVIVSRTDAHRGAIDSDKDESLVALTAEQQAAVDAIIESMRTGTYQPFLLEGVTGSGKTIVYQRAVAHALEQGTSALLLVPEISLTPQLLDRFRIVFGDRVAVLHSRMGVGERADTWRAIRMGEKPFVIGARSAVFAPLASCGLIIVDEEHEPSYKQDDPAPRYQGRDAAMMRASLEKCTVVMGTATPSVETRYAAERGRVRHLHLTHRADGAVLPVVRIVDLREARKNGQLHGSFTRTLLDAVQERIERKEGTILFLNRRGFASQLQCQDCGDVPMCSNCDVALTYHKASFSMRCHYCGYSEPARTMCLVCGSVDVKEVGSGTQRVEEELTEYLQGRDVPAVIHRMDIDTTQRKGSHRSILQRFAGGEIDVLVGTQMIAKGLDIGRVTLVGVINADSQLHHSDFRASERTVQLLTQVAGRAGRTGARPGEVIIQTYSPDHPAIQASVNLQLEPWYRTELATRQEIHYPPFDRFIVIECSGLDEQTVTQHAMILAQLIPAVTPTFIRLDPVPPPIARLRNRFRQVIVIKNHKDADPSGKICRAHLQAALETYTTTYAHATVRVTVDVDASGTM